jgi:YfiH family protein
MNTRSIFTDQRISSGVAELVFPGAEGGVPGAGPAPRALLTLRECGSMRFRWGEKNPVRDKTLAGICGDKAVVTAKLVHSQTVAVVTAARDIKKGAELDGFVTTNAGVALTVTIADCMPIFLWDPATGAFGVVHSGWRGTGIAAVALEKAADAWGTDSGDVRIILGPHIHSCCYTVDEDRAEYFSNTFGPGCVGLGEIGDDGETRYHLSLAEANRLLLVQAGVAEDHIVHYTDCTGCDDHFGSFRRETAHLPPDVPLEERQKSITVMAAVICAAGGEGSA